MGGAYSRPKEIKSKYWDEYKQKLGPQDGKVVLITGCTTGIGYNAARACGEKGAEVVMLNRKSSRADDSLAALKKEVPAGKFALIECDLMSFASVRKACKEVQRKYPGGIDVLACNAGIMAMPDRATEDGFCSEMQTNHLSHWIMAAELWPLLEKAADRTGEARFITATSVARKTPGTKVLAKYYEKNGGNLGGDSDGLAMNGPRWVRYNQTKMANTVMIWALADKLAAKGSKIKALVSAPGLAATQLQVTTNESGGFGSLYTNLLFSMLGQSGEDGTLPLLMCMLSPEAQQGQLWEPCQGMGFYGVPKPLPSREKALDSEENKALMWQKSVEATGVDIKI